MSAALVVHSARTFARASRTSFPIALRALRSTAYLYTMKQPSLPVFHIDAFSAAPFGGNPAAVCLLTSALPDSVRQKIAQELNLSETAFVEPLTTSTSGDANDLQRSFAEDDSFRLRWFTPTVEVPLCGHATLAAAAALFAGRGNRNSALHFHTKSGVLTVQRTAAPGTSAASDAGSITASDGPARQCLLEMALPLVPPVDGVPLGCNTDALRRAVLAGSGLLASAAPIKSLHFAAGGGMNYALMVLDDAVSQAQLEGLHPDAAALRDAAPDGCVQGLVVTCRGDNPRYDFLSRFFGPWMGIDEDPVTGSAHCVLGPFWAGVHGRNELMARQCSRRGGDLALRLDEGAGRVVLSGPAVIVMQGTLNM